MKKKTYLLIAVLSLSLGRVAQAEDGEHTIHSEPSDLEVTASATYAGRYMWYGFDKYDDDGAFHPKMEVDLWGSGFVVELSSWTSVNSGHVKYDELEYGLAYHGHTGQGKGTVHYHAHWLYYDYPKRRSEYLDKQEIAAGFSLPHIFPVGNTAIEPFYDAVWIWPAKSDSRVKEIGGYLHRFGLKCDLPVSGLVEGKDQAFSLFADINYNGNMGLYHHTDSTDYDWSHATFGVNTGIELGDLTITPFLNYQISMEDRDNDENEFWGGATVAYPF